MNTFKWFIASFGAALGTTTGVLVNAAPGDLVYEADGGKVEITAQQAGQAATWAINAGAWSGAAADMLALCVTRESTETEEGPATKYYATVRGLKSASSGNVPVGTNGVRVVGRVE